MSVDIDLLHIVIYPALVLRRRAKALERVDDQVRAVARRMLELMHEAPGVGLAAPQVGLDWRMFVANPTGEPVDDWVLINPTLIDPAKETEDREEGCLSLPEINGSIRRSKSITVKGLGLDGCPIEHRADDLFARIIQHENDHLDGVLIVDRMPEIDRLANRRQLRELEKMAGNS